MDLDYNPLGHNHLVNTINNQTINQLFEEELDSLFLDGNSTRFWRLFLDHLPREQARSGRISRESVEKMIKASPLKLESLTQPTLQSSPESHLIDASSSLGLSVSNKLSESLEMDSFDFNSVDVLAGVKASTEFCPFKKNINCNPNERFPTFDGSCNNLMQPWLGKTNTPYKRYHEPAYDDRLSVPRIRSVLGGELPNPRIISRLVMSENSDIETAISHITAPFDDSGRIVDCPCNSNNPSCMSVNFPSNDNLLRMSCMKFTRSSAAFSSFDCRLGHREQLNLMTSFVDGTHIYGPSVSRSRELRSFQGGQMRSSQPINGKQYLPQAQDGACRGTNNQIKCFASGEGRVNENLALTSMHTIFLREHNRIASQLGRVNPRWDDERLFAEARKIVIGILQHVVYHEWLPIIVGWNTAAMFDLIPLNENRYYNGYNSNINPSLSGEFASAAFRFGHTLMRSSFRRFDANDRETSAPLSLFDIIFRPAEAYNANAGGIDAIVMGLLNEPSSKYDANLAGTLQNRLFEIRLGDGSVIAVDLAATNINRGRDHGIPSYNVMREKCGIKRANSFQDLQDTISIDKINLLAKAYKHVDDIDLYPGGLSETSVNGGVVGPTFACIIANQFRDLKRGDRFYFENGPSPTAFTLDQLNEIKKSSMAKLICNNFEINKIQPNAFMLPSQNLNNAKISCNWLPVMDLTKWRE
ncbi:chorion peroxidase-like isoform X2 [Brachionus plicatilis]|uniref:Chorion peroxidase-like isoform X2 n=1 Tax=Brachionus plicatilis TaxID=10195 RepID=A0A3M7TAE2_BRAPC|nr:chorion peroxidase-like isoform X2 [Brachionus plicatilis]